MYRDLDASVVLTCSSVNRGANGSLCGPLSVLFEVKPEADRTSRLESRENAGSTFTIPVTSDSHIISYKKTVQKIRPRDGVQEWKWMARWHYFQISSLAVNVEMDGGELPHDIVLSIQRVLNVDSNTHDDPLDDLSSDFTPVDILNGFFPDGTFTCQKYLHILNPLRRGIAWPYGCSSGSLGWEWAWTSAWN